MSGYPYLPGFENTETSRAAAKSVDAKRLRNLVVSTHRRFDGLTDAELDEYKPARCPTLRPRRVELTRQGVIVDTGRRRMSAFSRRLMIVWGLAKAS